MKCPNCGSENVTIETHQEDLGSVTTETRKSKYKEKGHGILWWLCVGWWWWMVDLMLWCFFFVPRLLVQIFKKKKYVGKETAVTTTVKNVHYVGICTCHDCGRVWRSDAP